MSFSFNFSGDDISDSELEQTTNELSKATISQPGYISTQTTIPSPEIVTSPQIHSLQSLLCAVPSQISYSHVTVPIPDLNGTTLSSSNAPNGSQCLPTIKVPRRSMFDIRQQLMAESDPMSSSDTTTTLLSGLATGDLSTGIYEGGFKTWECAVDLAGYVIAVAELDRMTKAISQSEEDGGIGIHVIELGAGSAIPSLVLLRNLLERRANTKRGSATEEENKRASKQVPRVKFTICDYNEDVLRLCTAANVLLTTLLVAGERQLDQEDMGEGDIDVDEICVATCLSVLEEAGIDIDFVSGAWGSEFTDIIHQTAGRDAGTSLDSARFSHVKTLVLASETIYSPGSLPAFTQTISELITQSRGGSRLLVAAKKVYFGLGGGVAEFEDELQRLKGTAEVVHSVDNAGVGRVILDVKV